MTERKHTSKGLWPAFFVLLGLVYLGVLIASLLHGTDIELFHPKGLIAQQEFRLLVITSVILLGVAVPSVLLFYFFAWKYRETNEKAAYEPSKRRSPFLVFTIWAVPSVVMVAMSIIMWTSTHKLDPHTPIASDTKTLTIEVVAMRWKWLFIYPEQHVASVNFVEIPVGTPVKFQLTADDTPMSSFWIPHLSGQLYAMTGHVNALNLLADIPGSYQGSSAEINGAGFAGMKFTANVETKAAFDQWVADTQQSSSPLDAAEYARLLEPSEDNPPHFYSNPPADLYANVVMKYMDMRDNNMADMEQK